MTDTIQNPTEDLGLSHDLWERLPAISVDPTQASAKDVFEMAGHIMLLRKTLIEVQKTAKQLEQRSRTLIDNDYGDFRYEQGRISASNTILDLLPMCFFGT